MAYTNFQLWMSFVALLRAFGTFNAWVTPHRLKSNVYSKQANQVNPLLARLFGTWTVLSGAICVATAYDPENITLLYVGLVSFILALGHFITESLIFKTSSIRDASIPFVIASTSIVMLLKQLSIF
eukprot:TRINITY_DN3228_c0_g1_i1.p2 TRINITY_DN3228_c0_g1~~TRINITY_DN3228_c0_g1_i1.p2  ORF type:complete len:126 (+),score=28.64 TRINITY_DN3228_c0_g1_i1:116-493(+)